MNNNFYKKYYKYKKKYLLLKKQKGGVDIKDCNGEALSVGGIYGSSVNENKLLEHYGKCIKPEDFIGFTEICYDNNIKIMALIKLGFSYEQILNSGINSEEKINTEIWVNKENIDDIFFIDAISKGYINLLSQRIDNTDEYRPILGLDKTIEYVKSALGKEKIDYTFRFNLAINLIRKIKNLKIEESKDLDFRLKPIWKELEKFNIQQSKIIKFI